MRGKRYGNKQRNETLSNEQNNNELTDLLILALTQIEMVNNLRIVFPEKE